jgi:hypothetical protein
MTGPKPLKTDHELCGRVSNCIHWMNIGGADMPTSALNCPRSRRGTKSDTMIAFDDEMPPAPSP